MGSHTLGLGAVLDFFGLGLAGLIAARMCMENPYIVLRQLMTVKSPAGARELLSHRRPAVRAAPGGRSEGKISLHPKP